MPPFLQATLRAFTPSAPRCSPTPHLPAPAHALSPLTPGPARPAPGVPPLPKGLWRRHPPPPPPPPPGHAAPGGEGRPSPACAAPWGRARLPLTDPRRTRCVCGVSPHNEGPVPAPLAAAGPPPRPAPPRPLATSRRRRPPRRGQAGGGPFRFMSELGSARRKPGGHLGSSGSGGGAGGRQASVGRAPSFPSPAAARGVSAFSEPGAGG